MMSFGFYVEVEGEEMAVDVVRKSRGWLVRRNLFEGGEGLVDMLMSDGLKFQQVTASGNTLNEATINFALAWIRAKKKGAGNG